MPRRRQPTILAIIRRREQVADLYVQGHTQTAIAEKLQIAQSTVSGDLQAIEAQWRQSTKGNFDSIRAKELEKLDRVEREAWAAWERSQKPAQSAVIDGDGNGPAARKTIRNQHGDLRALDTVLKCGAARRQMLGLDAPTKIAPVMPDGREPFKLAVEEMTTIELRAVRRLQQRALPAPIQDDIDEDETIDEEHDAEVIDTEEPPDDSHEPADVRDD